MQEAQDQRLLSLTQAFYNLIPHKFAARATPPVITTRELLLIKIEMMEALLQIGTARSIAAELESESTLATHPADANYAKLKCALSEASPDEVAMVKEVAPPPPPPPPLRTVVPALAF